MGSPIKSLRYYPTRGGGQLRSLLWRPVLPEGWELKGVAGQGSPEIDPIDGSLVFSGFDLSANPLTFSYTVEVPEGTTLPQMVSLLVFSCQA